MINTTVQNLEIPARVVAEVLRHLDAGRPEAAANALRVEYDRQPGEWEIARLANMIAPCGMVAEARAILLQLKNQLLQPS